MHAIIWGALGLVGVVGLLGVVSPRWFAVVAGRSSQWVDTDKALSLLDKDFNIDRYVLPHCRVLGAAALAAVGVIALLLARS